MMPDNSRYRTGLWAEALCRLSLRLKGYRILAHRWRSPRGEIDIVALRGNVLAVVEVKARRDLAQALVALGPQQQHRLRAAAALLPQQDPRLATCVVRFDLMLVTPWRWPRHIPNAF